MLGVDLGFVDLQALGRTSCWAPLQDVSQTHQAWGSSGSLLQMPGWGTAKASYGESENLMPAPGPLEIRFVEVSHQLKWWDCFGAVGGRKQFHASSCCC